MSRHPTFSISSSEGAIGRNINLAIFDGNIERIKDILVPGSEVSRLRMEQLEELQPRNTDGLERGNMDSTPPADEDDGLFKVFRARHIQMMALGESLCWTS